jgi:hypothetical protein
MDIPVVEITQAIAMRLSKAEIANRTSHQHFVFNL